MNTTRLITTIVGLCLGAATIAQEAADDTGIPPQPLNKALEQFADQSGLQIIYVAELAEGKDTPGAKPNLSDTETLDQLLASTGLQYEFLNDNTVTVQAAADDAGGDSDSGNGRPAGATPTPVMMAQAVERSQTLQERGTDSDEGEKKRPLEEIIVTGTNIRGIAPESSPLDIYGKADIQALGATNTREFLSRLPQNLSASTSISGDEIFRQGNRNQINSPDLRGLGQGTTLVLLNGRRLPLSNDGSAADVSLIPIAAVERVEVLSDGASSVFGTDAIGGVVNFILQDEYDGAISTLTGTAVTDGNFKSGEFNQIIGKSWHSGGILGSFTVTGASELRAEDRDFAAASRPRDLSPDEEGYSALLTAHQDIGERFRLFGDFLYSNRDVKSIRSQIDNSILNNKDEIEQYFATTGASAKLTDDLTFDFVFSYAKSENESDSLRFSIDGTTSADVFDDMYDSFEYIAKVDGPLFPVFGNEIKFSLGAGRFNEDYETIRSGDFEAVIPGVTLERNTDYVFGELQIPLVGEKQDFPLANRIEINTSARYTDTSDAGDSLDPKVGLLWEFNESLQLRGTYSTSFRAPRLTERAPSDIGVFILSVDSFGGNFPDPFTNDRSTVYFQRNQATNPNLKPEEATNYTAGFDFTPNFAPGLSMKGTYFYIKFTDRIDTPTNDILGALAEPDLFAAVIRDSTLEEIAAVLPQTSVLLDFSGNGLSLNSTPEEILAVVNKVFDLGIANISSLKTDGFDFTADYQTTTAIGELAIGGAMTYLLSNKQRLTASSPVDERLDTITNPIDLRFRTYIGLSRGGWNGRVNVNYVDSYKNIPESGQDKISSWTTVDLVGSYGFPVRQEGWLSGVEVRLNVQNLLNEDPPFVASAFSGVTNPVGFDPANANPFGRLVTVQIVKSW